MAFTSGNILILLFLLLSSSLYSANLEFIYDNNTMNVKLLFTQEFSVHEPKKEGRIFSVRLKTNEALDNITKEFWGYPLERVFTTSEGMYKLINFEFIDDAYDAELKRTGNILYITFKSKSIPANIDRPVGGLYLRAFIGLFVVIIFLLILFWLFKIVTRGKVSSVIPGVGRMLGKIDITVGKSLYFYELGHYIYLLAISSNNITLIDKIEDSEVVTIIREGFAKRKDFSSYFRFFSRKSLNEDINITKTIIEEKLNSLRKK